MTPGVPFPPRVSLFTAPTPLTLLPRLSAELGRQVYIKHDDGIGPGMGGSKTRKLEFLLADAQRRGARKVVTFGGLQSNHARITAAAACKLGLEPHIFFFERTPPAYPGNLLLDLLCNARLHFIPLGGDGGMTLEASNRLVRLLSRLLVGPGQYFIPVGGHNALGCLGYVLAAQELDEQTREAGIGSAWVLTAAGTGGTLAGLMAGFRFTNSCMQPLGLDVGKLWKGFPTSIARLAGEICAGLGRPDIRFAPESVPLIEERYVGEKYGIPSPAGKDALRRLARLEGILLDPVYTAKAFAGLLDWIENNPPGMPALEPDRPIIFLHTGGAPALFAFQ